MAIGDRDYMKPGFGRRAGSPWERLDPVTALLAVNIGVFILQFVFGKFGSPGRDGFVPDGQFSMNALMEGRVWTVFTHMFVHYSLGHILMNMALLFSAGKSLQSLIGAKYFLYLYFLSGVAGLLLELGVCWVTGGDIRTFAMAGASACICGVFVGLAAMLPREEITALIYFIIPVRVRLWTLAMVLFGSSLVLGVCQFLWPATFQMQIAHFAHIGGGLMGWWFVRMLGYSAVPASYDQMRRERQERERNREFAGVPRKQRVVDMDEPDNTVVPPVNAREFIEREIDPILEKIHAHGMASLTVEERQLLERGRKEILNKVKGKGKAKGGGA